jgi:ATP-dependent exoDNAse (exonuclease V) alpha subunit
MAVYFLNLKTFGRSGGSSAVSAAAYRSGERIHDERSGKTYDHSDRQDVMHKEILVPTRFSDSDMGWAKDRAHLWNAAENAESRKNARVAREYLVALPAELDPEQRLNLVRGFSQELTDRYQFALDLTVHAPRDFPGSDPRNFHAHLLATTREATPAGLAAKTTLELNDSRRRDLGLEPVVHELLFVRERWAGVTNEALREAGIDARVDHRSLAAQGIDREPYPYIPRAAYEMERHGYRSGQAERLRSEYRERVQSRMERDAAAGRHSIESRQGQQSSTASVPSDEAARTQAEPVVRQRQSLEEIRREARENWLKRRHVSAETSAAAERAAATSKSVSASAASAATAAAPAAATATATTTTTAPATAARSATAPGRSRDDDLSR